MLQFGLLEMWGKRSKIVKSAVHVPCWEAFTWYPWKWRGLCFGRQVKARCPITNYVSKHSALQRQIGGSGAKRSSSCRAAAQQQASITYLW